MIIPWHFLIVQLLRFLGDHLVVIIECLGLSNSMSSSILSINRTRSNQ